MAYASQLRAKPSNQQAEEEFDHVWRNRGRIGVEIDVEEEASVCKSVTITTSHEMKLVVRIFVILDAGFGWLFVVGGAAVGNLGIFYSLMLLVLVVSLVTQKQGWLVH